jgi:peptidoglycan/xylan/chitin deacetylase (PgdA/CDA1 family)
MFLQKILALGGSLFRTPMAIAREVPSELMDAAQFPVILTYHSISEGNSPLKVSPSLFTEQMEWLKANVRVVPLGEVVAALAGRRPLPERTVVLTFDDGFRDFYTTAVPVLRRLRLPATVFLPSGYCGKSNDWPSQPCWVKREALLDWKQVTELVQDGFKIGAHGINHSDLTTLSLEEAEQEISGSRAQIEEHTSCSVEFFAYPYGRWTPMLRALVLGNFRAACATAAGIVEPDADPFALPRADAHYIRHPASLRMLFTTKFAAYIAARRWIRRVRRQPEGFYARV